MDETYFDESSFISKLKLPAKIRAINAKKGVSINGYPDLIKNRHNPGFRQIIQTSNDIDELRYLCKDLDAAIYSLNKVKERITNCKRLGECSKTRTYYKNIKAKYIDQGLTERDIDKTIAEMKKDKQTAQKRINMLKKSMKEATDFSDYVFNSLYLTEEEAGPKIDASGFGYSMTPLDANPGEIAIVSGDMFDAEMKHRLENFDKEQAKIILESKNIVQAYNDFVDLKIDRIDKYTDEEFQDAQFIFKNFKKAYSAFKYMGDSSIKAVKDGFVYRDQDPKFIKALLEARLEYANTTQRLLRKIIENNAKVLKLSSSQVQALISGSSPKNIKDMKDAISKNKDEFIKNKYLVDCRSIGAGVMITGKEFEIGSQYVKFDDYIQDLCNYDLVVLAHGGDSKYSEAGRESMIKRVKELLKKNGVENTAKYDLLNKKAIEAAKQGIEYKFTDEEQKYVDKVTELIGQNADFVQGDFGKSAKDDRWEFIYPITFVDGRRYSNVVNFIRAAKKQGFKKIKLYSCNPGSYDLPADLKPGVVFSRRTNYVENAFVQDYEVAENPYLEGAFQLEELAIELCEQYDIDYYDDIYLNECMNYYVFKDEVITEGIIANAFSKLVEFIKTIIAAIVGFIKKIAEAIKNLITKIVDFIKNKDQRKMNNKSVEVTSIRLEAAKLKSSKVSSQHELYKVIESDLNTIAKEYRKVAENQARINKQLQNQLKQVANKEKANESFVINSGTNFADYILDEFHE